MNARQLRMVGGLRPKHQAVIKAWGTTSGAGAPTLNTNFGVSSITDAGVGLLDITYNQPFGSALYTVVGVCRGTSNLLVCRVSNTTVPTATVTRLQANGQTGTLTDPGLGYGWITFGI